MTDISMHIIRDPLPTIKQPSVAELEKFIEVFHKLDQFSAFEKHNRGYGAFENSDPSTKEVAKVMLWLKNIIYVEKNT